MTPLTNAVWIWDHTRVTAAAVAFAMRSPKHGECLRQGFIKPQIHITGAELLTKESPAVDGLIHENIKVGSYTPYIPPI